VAAKRGLKLRQK